MQKFDFDGLYHIILKWDFFRDLREEELFTKHLEEDKTWELLLSPTETNIGLETIPIRFSSSEDYIKIFHSLFLIETRAQLTRAKYTEREQSEKFTLNFIRSDEKRRFCQFELLRNVSQRISYTNGDLILIHINPVTDDKQKEHTLAIVDKFHANTLICRVDLDMNQEKSNALGKVLIKNSEWYVTKICNMATIGREYQALMTIDDLILAESLLNPKEDIHNNNNNNNNNDIYGYIDNIKLHDDYFHISSKLERKLKLKFNPSQYIAIKSSIKKQGFTFIQGPPGTGKSTTILGVLSVLLNATIIKEVSDRKNSVVLQVSKEMLSEHLEEQKKENILPKTHPWLFSSNPYGHFDNIDFEIDDIFTYKDFVKDSPTLLQKPNEGDISPPKKILVCAPSNVAIDEIVRKLINVGLYDNDGNLHKPSFVRIGPNYNNNIKEYCLDYILTQFNGVNVDRKRNEILNNSKIICSTLSMAGSNILTSLNMKFDTVVIDEASQAVELATLIPLRYNCERLILVGDPNQLSATVFSSTALKHKYDQSLFTRFRKAGHTVQILKTQYRMQAEVSNFISEVFYDGLVENDSSVYQFKPEQFSHHPAFGAMTFYDIQSTEEFVGNSFKNEGQIEVIVELVKYLKEIYKGDYKTLINKLAILSPYSKQVNDINIALQKEICDPNDKNVKVEVNTIDGYQGKEKSIVIFSTVRSKGSKTIGFLADERRINVGLTRAKACLIIIGDSSVLMKDKNWKRLVGYSYKKGTFYKVKGNVKGYFKTFEKNYKKYCAKNEKQFKELMQEVSDGMELD